MNEQDFRRGCEQLADAIVAGCQGKEQIHGYFWQRNEAGIIIGCCAFGGAYLGQHPEAITTYLGELDLAHVEETFPFLYAVVYPPEGVEINSVTLFGIITELNDSRGWMPEQIATWVRTARRIQGYND